MNRMLRQLGIYYHHLPGNLSYNKFTCGVVLHVIRKNENVECWNSTKCLFFFGICVILLYRGADKSLVLTNSRCILFEGENISFDTSLVLYIYK